MTWGDFIKWVLIVNGAFLLIYLVLMLLTGRGKDDIDWGDDEKKKRHRYRR